MSLSPDSDNSAELSCHFPNSSTNSKLLVNEHLSIYLFLFFNNEYMCIRFDIPLREKWLCISDRIACLQKANVKPIVKLLTLCSFFYSGVPPGFRH